jgi:hypothetical protein
MATGWRQGEGILPLGDGQIREFLVIASKNDFPANLE